MANNAMQPSRKSAILMASVRRRRASGMADADKSEVVRPADDVSCRLEQGSPWDGINIPTAPKF